MARLASKSVRKILPARAALRFPIAASAVVDEKTKAAVAPRFPRRYARSGIASSNKSNHGRAKVSALWDGHQSGNCKLTSLHETGRFLEQHTTVRGRSLVAGELDQVAA